MSWKWLDLAKCIKSMWDSSNQIMSLSQNGGCRVTNSVF